MLYSKINSDSLKQSLALRMANIFASYSDKAIINKNIEKEIFDIVKILDNKK